VKWQVTAVVVVGALGVLGYYTYKRARAIAVPGGPVAAAPVAGALSGFAWLSGDPLGWMVRGRRIDKEELDDLA
jgi:hypothetical protein